MSDIRKRLRKNEITLMHEAADQIDQLVEALEIIVHEAETIMVTNKAYGDPTGPIYEEWFALTNARAAIDKATNNAA